MPERKVRYAVVGLGNIAQRAVLPAFKHARENSELVALVSADAEKLRVLSAQYGAEVSGHYDDLERILEESRADAIYCALPNSMHRELTERAASAGVHVLCEKPMATTVADAEAMREACSAAGVKLMVAYRLHFDRANLRTIQIVKSGAIGLPRIFDSVFCHQVRAADIRTKASTGGGALFDMGIYCINAARNLFQCEPIRVSGALSRSSDLRFSEASEMATGVLHFPGGCIAQFTSSQGAASVASYTVCGTEGRVRVEEAYSYADEISVEVSVMRHKKTMHFPKRDQFAPELVYFSRCILEDDEPEPNGVEGLCDVRVMCALEESARTGTSVRLPEYSKKERPDMRMEMHKPPITAPRTLLMPSASFK